MARTIKFEGRTISVPDDATDDEVASIIDQAAPAPRKQMKPEVAPSFGDDLSAGIAHSASKTVRGLATTLLPEGAEKWLEGKKIIPSAQDVATLEQMRNRSAGGQIMGGVADAATAALPVSRAMKGASALKQALPRAAGIGAVEGGVRAEKGDTLSEGVSGAVGGVLGEGVGRTITGLASKLVKPSEGAKELMSRGITPTLGEAVETGGKRYLGKTLSFLEDQLANMPVSGALVRSARQGTANKLFDEAATLATAPGIAKPAGSTEEVVRNLRSRGSEQMGDILNKTKLKITDAERTAANQKIDDLAEQMGISPEIASQLKVELNSKLWSGVRGNTAPANLVENTADDLFSGNFKALRGNTNAQRLANEVAKDMKEWVNVGATQAGRDLPGTRQALAATHALRRATRVGEEGVSGERLMRGVNANDAAVGASDTATRELRDLAESAKSVRGAPEPWGFRTPQQLGRAVMGGGLEAAGSIVAPVANVAGMTYGAINKSDLMKRLMLGDKAALEAVRNALRAPSVVAGTELSTEN